MKMRAIYPGSFDPFTLGHLNILERATRMFDQIDIVLANNSAKSYYFTSEQRITIVNKSIEDLLSQTNTDIRILLYDGIIADYINEQQIHVILRGIRGSTDLDYEIRLEQYNQKASCAETIYLTPQTEHLNTSSSLVKMFLQSGKLNLASDYLSPHALSYIQSLDFTDKATI